MKRFVARTAAPHGPEPERRTSLRQRRSKPTSSSESSARLRANAQCLQEYRARSSASGRVGHGESGHASGAGNGQHVAAGRIDVETIAHVLDAQAHVHAPADAVTAEEIVEPVWRPGDAVAGQAIDRIVEPIAHVRET